MSDKHGLELKGYNALLAEHCALVDRVAAIEALLERLGLTQMAVDEMLLIGRTPDDPQSAHQ